MQHVRKLLFILSPPLLIGGSFFLYKKIETIGCKKASVVFIEAYEPGGYAALKQANKIDEVTDGLCKTILW